MDGGTLQSKLTRFLFRYHITPHSTTGITPAEMLLGRRPRSKLDLVHPDVAGKVAKKQDPMKAQGPAKPVRAFQVGDRVYGRDYRDKANKWLPGGSRDHCPTTSVEVSGGGSSDVMWMGFCQEHGDRGHSIGW